MDAILVFQGGGSLGAYECGVYAALAPWLERRGHRLVAVSGTSIGAINGSVVVANYGDADRGANALQGFWQSLGNPSLPFLPPLAPFESWNALWTSLLTGHPRLFWPRVPVWNFLPPVAWGPFTAFYATTPMEQTLAGVFDQIEKTAGRPRLLITAIDLATLQPATFDSWNMPITPRHVVASCSLPPNFPATMIAGRHYWDGGLWSNTPLREALNVLQKDESSGFAQDIGDCLVFIVDLFGPAAEAARIGGNWDVWALRDRVLFQDKTAYDEKASARVNKHINFVRNLQEALARTTSNETTADAKALVDAEYDRLSRERTRYLRIHRFIRRDAAADAVAREIDFSPQRLTALIEQGRRDAAAQLARLPEEASTSAPPAERLAG